MASYLGRCMKCKGAARIEPQREVREVHLGYGRKDWVARFILPSGARIEGRPSEFWAPCICGTSVRFQQIRATESRTQCGAKCRNAHGPSCDCSCKGRNHGCSYT